MEIWHMRIAGCIPKATNTHSDYVIFIAFPLQQWVHERALMLRYMYIACPVLWLLYIDCVIVIRHPDDVAVVPKHVAAE